MNVEVFELMALLQRADEKVPEGGLTYTRAVAKILAIAGVPDPFCGYARLLPEQCVKAFKTGRTIEVVRDGIVGVDEAAAEISNA